MLLARFGTVSSFDCKTIISNHSWHCILFVAIKVLWCFILLTATSTSEVCLNNCNV
jgi:hypothetical protein